MQNINNQTIFTKENHWNVPSYERPDFKIEIKTPYVATSRGQLIEIHSTHGSNRRIEKQMSLSYDEATTLRAALDSIIEAYDASPKNEYGVVTAPARPITTLVERTAALRETAAELKQIVEEAEAEIEAAENIDRAELAKLNLTELETAFMVAFINGLYAEPYFSDQIVADVAEQMTVPGHHPVSVPTAKGVLGSLVKKGLLWTEDSGTGYDIIYLVGEYFHLHRKWREDEGMTRDPQTGAWSVLADPLHRA